MAEKENACCSNPKYKSDDKPPRLSRLCRLLAICVLTVPIEALALTFKSDGSIVQNSGAVVRADDASRYQAALEAFNRGEPVEDWPTSGGAISAGKSGYFGEKILEAGAPLYSIRNVRGSGDEIIEAIAKQNGFASSDGLKLSIIANSNDDFQKENNLDLGTVEEVQKTFKTLSAAGVLKAAPEIPLDGDITGNAGGLVEDEMIEIEGVDMDDDLATIAEKLGLDESLVTSRAVAETLSSMQETISAGSIADSLSSIGETIEIDESLITSEAMRETLSAVQETISEEISEEYSPPPAIDPATGAAPKPPG